MRISRVSMARKAFRNESQTRQQARFTFTSAQDLLGGMWTRAEGISRLPKILKGTSSISIGDHQNTAPLPFRTRLCHPKLVSECDSVFPGVRTFRLQFLFLDFVVVRGRDGTFLGDSTNVKWSGSIMSFAKKLSDSLKSTHDKKILTKIFLCHVEKRGSRYSPTIIFFRNRLSSNPIIFWRSLGCIWSTLDLWNRCKTRHLFP